MKKCVETLQKQTMAVVFNIQNFQLLTWSLPTKEIFQIHGQNRPMANLPVVNFRSQRYQTRNKTIFFTCASAAFLRKSLYNTVGNMIIRIINSVYKTKLSYFIPLPPAQHHSFCKNLPHYSIRYKIESRPRPRSRQRYFPLLGLVWF